MLEPAKPLDELSRLESLRSLHVLDTQSEERFDRLTRLAKRMFKVPIALVSLVDENRQWFKSCIGLPVLETPRDISFCGHAILRDDIFLIPDTSKDDRFVDNPLVTGDPYIRFYAGCPLRALDGRKLGTLCVIDDKPREFNEDDFDAMHDLAAMVESELVAVELAIQDELTKISNRRGFFMHAEHLLHICDRQNLLATFSFFDLDGFKQINDRFGHAAGDRALVGFAKTMESDFRSSDLIARLGGDEFVVLQMNTSQAEALESVDRFRARLEAYNRETDAGFELRFSSGVVEYCAKSHKTLDWLDK